MGALKILSKNGQERANNDEVRPPFPLNGPTSASWREQSLSRIAELRFVRDWLLDSMKGELVDDTSGEARIGEARIAEARRTIDEQLGAASTAAKGGSLWKPSNLAAALTGSGVERVISQLDAVEGELLRLAPSHYLRGEISSLLAHVQLHLRPDDPRRIRLEAIAAEVVSSEQNHSAVLSNGSPKTAQESADGSARTDAVAGKSSGAVGTAPGGNPKQRSGLTESDRQAVISAVRAASSESRWKVSRLRSFRNVILVTALVLALGAAGLVFFAFHRPGDLPVCFSPANVVCPTSTTFVAPPAQESAGGQQSPAGQARTAAIMRKVSTGWDVVVIELVGLIAAAIAAAAALRNVRGTSTPYSLPVALAFLKLPTGALTAVLGLLLMRGNFVPGLSALDSSAQIIAWALVFGYSQQAFTHLVDKQAQTVLDGSAGNTASLSAPAGSVRTNSSTATPAPT